MHKFNLKLFLLLWLPAWASAQFQFFEQVFQGGHHQHHQHHHQQHQQHQQNVASDASWYRQNYEAGMCVCFSQMQLLKCHVDVYLFLLLSCHLLSSCNGTMTKRTSHRVLTCQPATCSNYLCPKTLSCVHFPHHCPCAFPESQDKFELGEGVAVCASKGGWKAGEAGRKIELARKGLL